MYRGNLALSKATGTTVKVGDESVSLKREGRSTLVFAKILGRRKDPHDGTETLWLDRLVHTNGETFIGWQASGAISTVLQQEVATTTTQAR